MNTVDIIILILFVPAFIRGISKGFIDQVVSIVSLILGVWLSWHFAAKVSEYLDPFLEVSQTVLNVISFLVIMIAVVVGLKLLGSAIEKLVKFVMLGWLDKVLGFAFSLLTMALVVGILAAVFDSINVKFNLVSGDLLASSLLYNPLKAFGLTVFPFLKQLFMKS